MYHLKYVQIALALFGSPLVALLPDQAFFPWLPLSALRLVAAFLLSAVMLYLTAQADRVIQHIREEAADQVINGVVSSARRVPSTD